MRFLDVIVGAMCDELLLSRIEAGSESRTLLSCSSNGIIGDLDDLILLGEADDGVGDNLSSMSEKGEDIERDVSNAGSASTPLRLRMAQFRGGLGPYTRSRTRSEGESSGSCLSSDGSDFAEERREVTLRLFPWKLGVIGLDGSRS